MNMHPFKCYGTALLVLTALLSPQAAAGQEPAERLQAVLWIGGFAHDFEAIGKIMADDLAGRLPIEIEVVRDGSFLDSPKTASVDVILMNHCFKSADGVLTDRQKQKLLELVRGGVGVVAVHASYYSFPEWDACRDLYGARFIKHGSTEVELVVTVVDRDHPITKGLAGAFEVRSELYQSTPLADDCHVLARAREKGTSQEYPSAWTRPFGKGRVVTILPAHWPDAYRVPEFQKLIAAAARWAARRPHKHQQEEHP
jgi:type 1 glutamine amidotransferase